MNEPISDGALEALLKTRGNAPLSDDGFTQRVMHSLPAQHVLTPAKRPARSRVTLWIGTAAALAIVLMLARGQTTGATAVFELNAEPILKSAGELLSNQSLWTAIAMLTATFATLYYLDTTQSEE